MKRFFLYLLATSFLISGCSKQENQTQPTKTFSEIKDVIVYNLNNEETSITGDVYLQSKSLPGNIMELGTVKEGKLNLLFPDLPPDKYGMFITEINSIFYGIQVTPEDASWFLLDDSMSLIVFTDEDVANTGNPQITRKQNYLLEFVEQSEASSVWFAYFFNDTEVKGRTNIFGYTYDIDINASKGWNMIDIIYSESNASFKTLNSSPSSIKWTAERTRTTADILNDSPFGSITPRGHAVIEREGFR